MKARVVAVATISVLVAAAAFAALLAANQPGLSATVPLRGFRNGLWQDATIVIRNGGPIPVEVYITGLRFSWSGVAYGFFSSYLRSDPIPVGGVREFHFGDLAVGHIPEGSIEQIFVDINHRERTLVVDVYIGHLTGFGILAAVLPYVVIPGAVAVAVALILIRSRLGFPPLQTRLAKWQGPSSRRTCPGCGGALVFAQSKLHCPSERRYVWL